MDKIFRYPLMTIVSILLPLSLLYVASLRVNLTSSMPVGLYWKSYTNTLNNGVLLSVCLPNKIACAGKLRGYIGLGFCLGNSIPLLKKIIALPGDTVILSKNSIQVNGVAYYAPQQEFDHNHKNIKHWIKNGVYKHVKGVWVYSSHDPIHSWDSRYFGAIPAKNIQGVYKPLWVFS